MYYKGWQSGLFVKIMCIAGRININLTCHSQNRYLVEVVVEVGVVVMVIILQLIHIVNLWSLVKLV